MQTLDWLDTHVGSIEDGIELTNRFHWFLSVVKATVIEGELPYWYVKGGEKVIFSADSREAVDAFLYGMSLVYSVIPPLLFDKLVEETNEL